MTTVRPCPSCGQVLDLSGFAPGEQVACPRCGLSIAIAAASATVSVPGSPVDYDAGTEAPASIAPRPAKSRTSALSGGPARRISRADRRSAPVAMIGSLAAALVVVLVLFGIASDWDDESESTPTPAVPAPIMAERPSSTPVQRSSRRSAVEVAKVDESTDSSDTAGQDSLDSNAPAEKRTAEKPTANQASMLAAGNSAANGPSANGTAGSESPAIDSPAAGAVSQSASMTPPTKPDAKPEEKPDAKPTSAGGVPSEYVTKAPAAQAGGEMVKAEKQPEKQLSPAEQKRLGYMTQLRKLVNRHFVAERRSPDLARGKPEDFFVVAKYEMPLSTRVADVRFEITDTLDKSVDQVVDYLMASPTGSARDFQVVARFGSMSEAADGIVQVRQQYDQVKEYQAKLLEYLRTQQRLQATATRRC